MPTETGYNVTLLKAVRQAGWSIEELSGLTQIPESILYKFLNGMDEPGEASRHRIAGVLGCEVDELFPQNGDNR